MGRNTRTAIAKEDTGLHVSYGGGKDTSLMQPSLMAMYADFVSIRRFGWNVLANPDTAGSMDDRTDPEIAAEVSRLVDLSTERRFREWGPEHYPLLKYDTPPAVQRGFEEHLALTGDRPLPPKPFFVDAARYHSRSGMVFDMDRMRSDIETAACAGRVVHYACETAPHA